MNPPGKATHPLRLPKKAPLCFDSQAQWDEYRVLTIESGKDGHTFCTDCTKAYQSKMILHGRCKYPGTRFQYRGGVLVGQRRKI